ncbi:hypothetical protein Q4F19_00870 [Sphingomonas sp. BIUV-7]|uniref:Uncharacterized protein n=1 Tax=Sphingomonas natans TaxID=3063330 RepID=A0ABT8Y3P5_9SPHN|nr:hypothetical protein [Sphingomonas sp. BIUV-7]MDO6412924.1 hypothetical protein [Sphingomonas sp. BIUV-7]
MSRSVFPMWVFLAVALAIAVVAFGLGQISRGAGVPLVAAATTLWVAYVAQRGRRIAK